VPAAGAALEASRLVIYLSFGASRDPVSSNNALFHTVVAAFTQRR